MYELTITAVANLAIQDELGLESLAPEAQFRGAGVSAGQTAVYRLTNSTWDRVRPRLRALTQRRVPTVDATTGLSILDSTQAVCFYTLVPVPGRQPRINQIEQTAAIDLVTDGVLTLRGTNLMAGLKAKLDVYVQSGAILPGTTGQARFSAPVKVHTYTAVAVGPIGNQIGVRIEPASGGGSVATKIFKDGKFQITVTPASGSATATAIAAQVNGDTLAASLVTATAVVGSAIVPQTTEQPFYTQAPQVKRETHAYLSGGDGGGVAILDVPVVDGVMTNRLHLVAQKSGNASNQIGLILKMSQGGNSVAVSNKVITVNRTGATETIANLVTAINGNAAAAALVVASAVGSGSLAALTVRYFYGGAAEEPTATVGGAAATVTSMTDTSMVLSVLAAALVTAGVASGEEVVLQVIYGDTELSGQVHLT